MDNQGLGSEMEALVGELLEGGRFTSREDVLREGVRLVGEREKLLAELDQRLSKGLADMRSGDVEDAEAVFERLIARYENTNKSAA